MILNIYSMVTVMEQQMKATFQLKPNVGSVSARIEASQAVSAVRSLIAVVRGL